MLIAQAKRKENIAEYVLYMWQVEDMIRGLGMDIQSIEETIIEKQTADEDQVVAIRKWYEDLIRKMKNQGIEESGHLAEVNEVMVELFYLHNSLLNTVDDERYKQLFEEAVPHIEEFQSVSGKQSPNPIEICMTALYGKLLLRLKGQEISDATEESFEKFRSLLAHLAKKYKEMMAGHLN